MRRRTTPRPRLRHGRRGHEPFRGSRRRMTTGAPSGIRTMSSAALDSSLPAPRSRVIAALLSLIAPGVGHLYAGAPRRALIVFVAVTALAPLVVAGAFLLPPSFK